MSVWLGPPERNTKMQFFAVFCRFGVTAETVSKRLALATSAKYEATMPVPAICRKRRRENPSPQNGEVPCGGQLQSFESCFFMAASVEQKLQPVEQRELEILGLRREVAALEIGDRGVALVLRRIARQRRDVHLLDDRRGIARHLQQLGDSRFHA